MGIQMSKEEVVNQILSPPIEPRSESDSFDPSNPFGYTQEDIERHPFNKPFVDNIDMGWIGEFGDWGAKTTGSPVEFFELIGLVTLAAAIPNATIPVSFAGEGGLRVNVYGCIVAPTSAYGKSTALRKATEVLQPDFMRDCRILPNTFTEEGLYSELAEHSSGIVVKDEIGMLFDSHKKKYMAGVTQSLTQIYDGDSFSKRLSLVEIRVNNPYLNIIGATTPYRFHNSVRTIDWHDGFLPRWLIVVPKDKPDFSYSPPLWDDEIQRERERLSKFLVDVHAIPSTKFMLDEGGYADYVAWRRERMEEAFEYGDESFMGFVSRYCTYALKFSLLLSVARKSKWGTIPKSCIRDGMALADNYKKHLLTLLTEKRDKTVDGGKLQLVFKTIQKREQENGDGVARGEIDRYANVDKSIREECIDKLLEMGAVSEQKVKGRRTKRLFSNVSNLPISGHYSSN